MLKKCYNVKGLLKKGPFAAKYYGGYNAEK